MLTVAALAVVVVGVPDGSASTATAAGRFGDGRVGGVEGEGERSWFMTTTITTTGAALFLAA